MSSEASKPDAASHAHTNRLSLETSPYLLQHQHNPVDWYPWGDEAFERARREDKPIFLSVGYSTCYWCHVMERQSFESESVAAVMNAKFVCIKVDREERPDVDQLYMTAVQTLTRQGGWPMSVWLTPDLRPFYGGTYYPPEESYGRPGFVSLLEGLDDAWKNRRKDVEESADHLARILKTLAEPSPAKTDLVIDGSFIDHLIDRSTADYDPRQGGFGGAPKFPRETLLELLLVYTDPNKQSSTSPRVDGIRRRLLHSLDALAIGGIRDHLGGGFHRYSTDAKWLVPHFEIMLYDNAMLAWCYAEAFRQTHEIRHASVARGILDFTLREMTSADGAFYTALDAEVDGQEGLNYLWTREQVIAALGPDDGAFFSSVYGLDAGPNFADPHHGNGVLDKNVLFIADIATAETHEARIAPLRETLRLIRAQRKQPLLDTKIITSWNALMIRAMAHAGQTLNEPRYTAAANRAADFLLASHSTDDSGLYRTSRDGKKQHAGMLDDYAFLVQALLAFDDSAGKRTHQAKDLMRQIALRFATSGLGGFAFTDVGASRELLVRQKVASDSPLPSGNAIATLSLLQRGDIATAGATVKAFAGQLNDNGESMSAMFQAALEYVRTQGPLHVRAGDRTGRPLSPQEQAAGLVTLAIEWTSPRELTLHVEIADGYHLQSHDAGRVLVSTHVALAAPGDAVRIEAVEFPEASLHRFDFSTDEVPVHAGDLSINVRFTAPPPASTQLALTFQACNDRACLPPVTLAISVPARDA